MSQLTKELIAHLVDVAHVGIIFYDLKGTVSIFNGTAAAITGLKPENIIGKSILTSGPFPEKYQKKLMAETEKKVLVQASIIGVTLENTPKPDRRFLSNVTFVKDPQSNKPMGYLHIFRDVTEAEGRITELKETSNYMRKILSGVGEGVIAYDRDGIITWVNPTAAKILGGYEDVEVLVGRQVKELKHFDKERLTRMFEDVEAYGEARGNEMELITLQGQKRHILSSLLPIRGEEGEILGYVHAMRDIYALKGREQLIEAVGIAIITTFPDGRIESMNRTAELVFSYPIEEAMEETFESLGIMSEEDFSSLIQSTINTGRKGKVRLGFECHILTGPDRRPGMDRRRHKRMALFTGSTINNQSGEPEYLIYVARDITELTELREKIIRSEKLVALGKFTSGIAHEINNPLASALGYNQLLSSKVRKEQAFISALPEKLDETITTELQEHFTDLLSYQTERLKTIEENILRIRKLVNQVRIVGQSDLKQVAEFNLDSIIGSATSHVLNQPKYAAMKDMAEIKTHIENIPPICGDDSQIERVIINFLTNSLDSIMDKKEIDTTGDYCGEIFISAEFDSGSEEVVIRHTDNGIGIKQEYQDRIFDFFFSTKKASDGTGIGLTEVYNCVERHNGHVEVESLEGEYTTFTVYMPVAAKPEANIFQDKPVMFQKADAVTTDKTILILDDEPDLRDLLSEILHDNTILTASSGKEALTLLAHENVDVLILDNKLHGETGLEILAGVKAKHPDLAILPISGNLDEADKEKYREAGITVFLDKPFDMDQIKNAIMQVLPG